MRPGSHASDPEEVAQTVKWWTYFVGRYGRVPSRSAGHRAPELVEDGQSVLPGRSMAGAPDLPGTLSALDDMDMRREIAVMRLEQTIQPS